MHGAVPPLLLLGSSVHIEPLKDKMSDVCMYVCVRGGPNQPLHRDLQWSIVLPPFLVIPLIVPHYEYSAGFYTWGH
jgi:hypothetical protein